MAEHDEKLIASATAERPIVAAPPVSAAATDSVPFGRRASDFATGVVTRVYEEASGIAAIWKDERGRWSTRRILLWAWTFLGAWSIWLEMTAKVYVVRNTIITPHFLNNAWISAWSVTEGALIVAVFGPVMIDYFKNAAPAMTAIGGALRDRAIDPVVAARRDKAAEVGSDGTEYNE